jgi:hypothetical protein
MNFVMTSAAALPWQNPFCGPFTRELVQTKM